MATIEQDGASEKPLPPEPKDPTATDSTMEATTTTTTTTTTGAPHTCRCPHCDFAFVDDALRQAHEQIQDLQAQVRLLNEKAAAAVDKWADYEDELARLRSQSHVQNKRQSQQQPTPASPARTSFLPAGAANRLSALLSPRSAKSTPNLKAMSANGGDVPPASVPVAAPAVAAVPTPPASATSYSHSTTSSASSATSATAATATTTTSTTATSELLAALAREQTLRRAAEGRLHDTSREVEELSVTLFEQANEMVADERRARAQLEKRVAVLEQRDTEKRRRLERLEQAMARIERVRALLGEVERSVAANGQSQGNGNGHGSGNGAPLSKTTTASSSSTTATATTADEEPRMVSATA